MTHQHVLNNRGTLWASPEHHLPTADTQCAPLHLLRLWGWADGPSGLIIAVKGRTCQRGCQLTPAGGIANQHKAQVRIPPCWAVCVGRTTELGTALQNSGHAVHEQWQGSAAVMAYAVRALPLGADRVRCSNTAWCGGT